MLDILASDLLRTHFHLERKWSRLLRKKFAEYDK
jgi:hypothetical protein